jgi:hypothetical protein
MLPWSRKKSYVGDDITARLVHHQRLSASTARLSNGDAGDRKRAQKDA